MPESSDDSMAALGQRFGQTGSGPLRDRVYSVLRWGILTGTLRPERKLTEQEVAGALKVSRTPVREAFRRLEPERLVSISTSRTVVVRGITMRDLAQIYQVRMPLEVLSGRLSAVHATAADHLELVRSVDLQRFFAQNERFEEFSPESNRFHDVIAESTGNPLLAIKLRELRDSELSVRGFVLRDRANVPHTLHEHAHICEAISMRNEDLAAELTGEHLRQIGRRIFGSDFERVLAEPQALEVHRAGMIRDFERP